MDNKVLYMEDDSLNYKASFSLQMLFLATSLVSSLLFLTLARKVRVYCYECKVHMYLECTRLSRALDSFPEWEVDEEEDEHEAQHELPLDAPNLMKSVRTVNLQHFATENIDINT